MVGTKEILLLSKHMSGLNSKNVFEGTCLEPEMPFPIETRLKWTGSVPRWPITFYF